MATKSYSFSTQKMLSKYITSRRTIRIKKGGKFYQHVYIFLYRLTENIIQSIRFPREFFLRTGSTKIGQKFNFILDKRSPIKNHFLFFPLENWECENKVLAKNYTSFWIYSCLRQLTSLSTSKKQMKTCFQQSQIKTSIKTNKAIIDSIIIFFFFSQKNCM